MHTSGGLEVRLIGGLVVFAVMALMLLVGIANITGFTFREVAEHARALLFAPVLFVVVWLIEKFEVPLPIRLGEHLAVYAGGRLERHPCAACHESSERRCCRDGVRNPVPRRLGGSTLVRRERMPDYCLRSFGYSWVCGA